MRLEYELPDGDGCAAAGSLSDSTAIELPAVSSLKCGRRIRVTAKGLRASGRHCVRQLYAVVPPGPGAVSPRGWRHCLPVGVQQLLEREAMQ